MSSDRPNILFLFSDEHSFRFMGHVPSTEGGEPVSTPTFDWLASKGSRFANTYCQMPLCTPSRLCLLTGREVRGAGAWGNKSVLRPELATMPGVLAESGYATCLVGKMHLGGSRQFVGFQHRPYGDLTGNCGHQREPIGGDLGGMRGRTAEAGVTEIPESMLQDAVVTHESIAWIREQAAAKPEQPWFLCASFSRPHFPLTAPKRYYDMYTGKTTEPKVPASGDAYDHPMSVGMRKGFKADAIDHDEMMWARQGYFACVSYLDEVLGDMFARLERQGLLDNTIIVYSSDHGEMAGEHGVWWKNGWYEACTHIPMLISTPEQRRGEVPAQTYRTPVALIDLFPTFCSLAGADTPADLDGSDLSAAVRGQGEPATRPIPTDSLTDRWGAGTEFRSVRHGDYKYVAFKDGSELLFNVVNDQSEQHDLINSSHPDDITALACLRQFVADTMDFDAATREYTEQTASNAKLYPMPDHEGHHGNLYHMPNGHIVNAESPYYHPQTVTKDPSTFFNDYPK